MTHKNIPQEIISEFTALLNKTGINYVMIGGLAISSWFAERFTNDLDLTIELDEKLWKNLHQKLYSSKDISIKQTSYYADSPLPHLIRLLYKDYPIDLLVAKTGLQKEIISRGINTKIFGPNVNLATPEDIIILKLLANRPQDIADINTLLEIFSDLDFLYIEKWAQEWEILPLWKELSKPKSKN